VSTVNAIRQPDWATAVGRSGNLYRVTATLYRSAQLGQADINTLHALGIHHVIGLRAFHSDDVWLHQSGIRTSRIRILTWALNDRNVATALAAIRRAEQQGPVLLHCWHGADRTGLVIAMYRVIYQDWSKQRALEELIHGGYGYHALWTNIPRYLRHADVARVRRMAELR
jgi:protein tyrosine/serine phosphatase